MIWENKVLPTYIGISGSGKTARLPDMQFAVQVGDTLKIAEYPVRQGFQSHGVIFNRTLVSLDIFWLKDESLSESENLPPPDIIAAEIVEDLEAALEQFREMLGDLGNAEATGEA